jgi:hypothetical protein
MFNRAEIMRETGKNKGKYVAKSVEKRKQKKEEILKFSSFLTYYFFENAVNIQ